MTAVERKCYQERGLQTQGEGWFICTEGDGAIDSRLVKRVESRRRYSAVT